MMNFSVYTKTARFDQSARELTEDEIYKVAPSIFSTSAHHSRSEVFKPIPTISVLRGLKTEGFSVVGVRQSNARDETKRDFTKHMVRMRRLDDNRSYSVGDKVHEIILKNANDGTAGYQLLSGLFRIQCLNSLVAQTATLEKISIRHSGDVKNKVIEGTYKVLSESEAVLSTAEKWQQLRLAPPEQMALAEAAHTVRFPEETPFKPEHLLKIRRRDDTAPDLWTTFNVIQENTMRGGLRTYATGENHRRRLVSTREIKGVDQSIKLNSALWTLAEKMAELKAA